MLRCEPQALAVAAREERVLAAAAAVPHRSDRVQDVARREAVTTRHLHLARLRAAERAALLEQARAGGAVASFRSARSMRATRSA